MDSDAFVRPDLVRMDRLQLHLVAERSCWISLPARLCQQLHSEQATLPVVFVLTGLYASGTQTSHHPGSTTSPPCFVAWAGSVSGLSNHVEMSSSLAACLRLRSGVTVRLDRYKQVLPQAQAVHVEPLQVEDWEVLQLNAGLLEHVLRSQVAVMAKGQPFCVWAHQTCIRLSTTACQPADLVVVGEGTEVYVAPKQRQVTTLSATLPVTSKLPMSQTEMRQGCSSAAAVAGRTGAPAAVFRVLMMNNNLLLPLPGASEQHTANSLSWLTAAVLVPPTNSHHAVLQSASVQVYNGMADEQTEQRHVRVLLLPSALCPEGHVMLAPPCMQLLGVLHHSQVILRVDTPPPGCTTQQLVSLIPDSVNLMASEMNTLASCQLERQPQPLATTTTDTALLPVHTRVFGGDDQGKVVSALRLWWSLQVHTIQELAGGIPLQVMYHQLWWTGRLIHLCVSNDEVVSEYCFMMKTNTGHSVQLTHSLQGPPSHGISYPTVPIHSCMASSSTARRWTGLGYGDSQQLSGAGATSSIMTARISNQEDPHPSAVDTPIIRTDLDTVIQFLCLSTPYVQHGGHVLVSGPNGSGKAQLASAVTGAATHTVGGSWHVIHLKCSDLKTVTSQSVTSMLDLAFSEAVLMAPSLMVLQDLDVLATQTQGEGGSEDDIPIAESILCAIKAYQLLGNNKPVRLLATCAAVAQVASQLRQAGIFDVEVRLPSPGEEQRLEWVLNSVMPGLSIPTEATKMLSGVTEGYEPQDLYALMDRASHLAAMRTATDLFCASPQVHIDDVEQIVAGYKPPVFWKFAKKQANMDHQGIKAVGGMASAKRHLTNSLLLPLKHSSTAGAAPLRLRTGVLLYGPPGCGKTHLVKCMAAEAQLQHNIRFISVKGPELLNKYIGASEAAVRDLFERAAQAAPCLLFFDEFDAIAPSRGHDSTGVTDRVVNQLLTELDGVEGLSGVAVLAATSRPDMIDAALLRPGRLDRLVYCGLPAEQDRLGILTVLSQHLSLADDVSLQAVAHATAGYTGADLGAVLAEAQLLNVHKQLDSAAEAAVGHITSADMQGAMQAVHKSISDVERSRLNKLYKKFQLDRSSTMGEHKQHWGKRVTAA